MSIILRRSILALIFLTTASRAPAGEALQRVTVHLVGCTDCAINPPIVSVWDARGDFQLRPLVAQRNADALVVFLRPGYYDLFLNSRNCSAERYLGVLPHHDRRFDMVLRCKPRQIVRIIDAMYGMGGVLPSSVRSISMRGSGNDSKAIIGTISGGAYYFDEANCHYCVLTLSLASGKTARIAATTSRENFSFATRDISSLAVQQRLSVRGSPFNSPEKLAEGPSGSIWVLDPLGNRVAVAEARRGFHEYDLPTPFANARDIVASAKSVWVDERNVGKIVRFRLDGSRIEYKIGDGPSFPSHLTLGADGRIWFIDGRRVGAIDESGAVSTYPVPSPVAWIDALVLGSDGRMWVGGESSLEGGKGNSFLSAVDATGHWKRFPISINPVTMLAGHNGLWVADRDDALSYVDLHGREIPAKVPMRYFGPKPYAVDKEDRVWFSDRYGNVIARATPTGVVTATYTDLGPAGISDMKIDENDNVWIAEQKSHIIEEYNKRFMTAPAGVNPRHLLFDSNGNLWYSDANADVVGEIAKNGKDRCYAFALSHIRRCAFQRADIINSRLP